MSTVEITTEVIKWAIERAGFSDEKLALRMHTKQEKIHDWISGKDFPNFIQAQKLASTLYIPLGYLVLANLPDTTIPIADFRTIPGNPSYTISLNLQEVIDDALRKRDWFSEWRRNEGYSSFGFIGKYSLSNDSMEIIQDIKQVLNISPGHAFKMTSWDEHLRFLVEKIEQAGILILQSGIVGNNTHRSLSIEEFRGFTLADEFAPLIFINAQDSIAARIFTLAHELAHLWTGTSGISNPEIVPSKKEDQQIEKLCNQIAAEFLVPQNEFIGSWNYLFNSIDNIKKLSFHFRVSTQVILRRSYELEIISYEEYVNNYREILKTIKIRGKKKGGNFYNSLFTRNSHRFTKTLMNAISGGKISYLDASRLLNIQPRSITKAMELMK